VRFANRHFVVTGAGRGIGRAIALRLASEGATVSRLQRSELDEPGAFRCDIRDRGDVDRAFAAATDANGPIHALVANAGIGGPNAAGEGDRFDDLVATNLTGTYSCVRAAERSAELTHVVVTSSILARIAVPGYTGYSASKAALLGLVRSFAAELAPRDVQVNAIVPGWVDTDMAWEGLDAMPGSREEAFAAAMREVPLGRMAQPEDIAGTVAWLLSDDARGVTGQGIDHNNGAFTS
jgi:NAD(P)-dependent dehydrogenase (short-subunit alcohol dehydrogenase family)